MHPKDMIAYNRSATARKPLLTQAVGEKGETLTVSPIEHIKWLNAHVVQ